MARCLFTRYWIVCIGRCEGKYRAGAGQNHLCYANSAALWFTPTVDSPAQRIEQYNEDTQPNANTHTRTHIHVHTHIQTHTQTGIPMEMEMH